MPSFIPIFFCSTPAEDTNEDAENKNVEPKVSDAQLQVISVLGTGSDLEMTSIDKAYHDPETCKRFERKAWVKLAHPFNPAQFIRSALVQFHKNLCVNQQSTVDFEKVLVATDNELIAEFMRQIRLKYLVVLEDVSTMVDWENVRSYLPDSKKWQLHCCAHATN